MEYRNGWKFLVAVFGAFYIDRFLREPFLLIQTFWRHHKIQISVSHYEIQNKTHVLKRAFLILAFLKIKNSRSTEYFFEKNNAFTVDFC